MRISREFMGRTGAGQDVSLYTLSNDNRMTVKIMTYGGIVTSLRVPDRRGKVDDVVLGFNTLEEYLQGNPFFGALVGRYGNRIARGQFELDGKTYQLAQNDGVNHLHGGLVGFDKVVWSASPIEQADEVGVALHYISKDGEEGYPGNLAVTVRYCLNQENALQIDYEATTDQPTVVNLTHHSYFNLAGEGSGDILGHEVTIHADYFTAVDDELIPTGELRPVKGTAMDFTTPRPVGARIDEVKGGYDHNYVLNKQIGECALIAQVSEPGSGRVMEVWTTEPGVQFYVGNSLDGTLIGKSGRPYTQRTGLCLEAQHYPDSPNHPEFPTTRLNPGETYRQTTIYKFV
jgi:aldose 1-epimerase